MICLLFTRILALYRRSEDKIDLSTITPSFKEPGRLPNRLEAIAMEAIATRLETIALRFLLLWRPLLSILFFGPRPLGQPSICLDRTQAPGATLFICVQQLLPEPLPKCLLRCGALRRFSEMFGQSPFG